MQDEFGKDIIWRKFFHSLLSVKHRENIFRCNFFLSSAGLKSFQNATMRGNYRLSLDTNTHNFVIFDCLTGAKLSTNTKKIIKLDDLSLLKHPDLLDDPKAAKMFLKSFKNCSKDSFFVCPSPVVANDLIKLDPSISTRVFIIPNVIPSIARIKPTVELLKNVITKSISLSIFSKYGGLRLKTNDFISCWFSEKIQIPKFIVCFSNLESKKNINTLVDAWSRLRLETKSDVKLLIFGNKINQIKEDKTHKEIEQQQLCDSALKCIKPYIISKDLIYLENVGNSDIALLYSAASCYVAPSFSETLCSAPLEALSCGCPAVVSDNPSNRFLLENAALYCDPYDEEDIANKIKSVLSNENDTNLEQRFNHDWLKIQEKFSSKTILDCWEKFFEAISPL